MINNILPISRRIVAQTIGKDLVSVQPLSAPSFIHPFFETNEQRVIRNSKKLIERINNRREDLLNY